jgi:hypothetical protein
MSESERILKAAQARADEVLDNKHPDKPFIQKLALSPGVLVGVALSSIPATVTALKELITKAAFNLKLKP